MKLKKYLLLIVVLLQIFLLAGCSNQKYDNEVLKQKGLAELDYMDTKLVSMLNLMNNLSFENYEVSTREVPLNDENSNSQSGGGSTSPGSGGGEQGSGGTGGSSSEGNSKKVTVSEMVSKNILLTDKKPKWDEIKREIENFYTSWNAIVLDLYKLNVPSENILSFSNSLDEATLAIKNEEKIGAISSLTTLYQHIPMYLSYTTNGTFEQSIKNTKYFVLSAYSALESDDWGTAKSELGNAIQNFMPIMDGSNYPENATYSINKTYITLMELQNSINLKDKDIFYINYRNLMEELNVL